MDPTNYCCDDEIDWDWEALLQQLPHLPGISIDDFLPPLDVESPVHIAEKELLDESTGIEAISNRDSFFHQLTALNDILMHDELTVDDHSGFPDDQELIQEYINSFLVSSDNTSDTQATEITQDVSVNLNTVDCEQVVPVSDVMIPSVQTSAHTAITKKRKRDRESGRKWRQSKKVYVKRLESKCRFMEGECGRLEHSLSYATLESATLRHELVRFNNVNAHESNPRPVCHGRAEPAVLLLSLESLQLESMFCLAFLLLLPLLQFLPKPRYMPRLPAAALLRSDTAGNVSTNFGGRRSSCSIGEGGNRPRRWRWRKVRLREIY